MAKGHKGVFRPKKKTTDTEDDLRVADFSYQNDSLAQMVVDAWTFKPFRDSLLDRKADGSVTPNAANAARSSLMARGICLNHPVVISEGEYNDGYHMKDDNEVVFVLPDHQRVMVAPQGQTLLETAKLLMACTPNGI